MGFVMCYMNFTALMEKLGMHQQKKKKSQKTKQIGGKKRQLLTPGKQVGQRRKYNHSILHDSAMNNIYNPNNINMEYC